MIPLAIDLTPQLPSSGTSYQRRLVTELTRTLLVQYAGASGDFNPLHTDERYAVEVAGYPSLFAHGMLTMGLMGSMLSSLFGDGALQSFEGRFAAQVWPGDSLDGSVTVIGREQAGAGTLLHLDLKVTNQHGQVVYTGNAVSRADYATTRDGAAVPQGGT